MQVVILGAGLDSRAWRLSLPPGVGWFEVDRADVIEHKHRCLSHVKAQSTTACVAGFKWAWQLPAAMLPAPFQQPRQSSQPDSAASAQHDAEKNRAAAGGAASVQHTAKCNGCQFLLKAATWAPVTADLSQADWPGKLKAAGFNTALPTVWVAEGLVYYM